MSQRSTSPLKRSTVRRTLQRFWDVTRTQPLIVFLSVFSSAGYIFLLTFANTYVMALIVDRVQAGPVAGDQVFEVFGPYILALVLVNLVGQILSKLQDYTVYKLEIAGNYHLARLCFDTLSNQSMTFHTSRFGGSLVSQTSRFMSGYTGLVDVTVYSLIPTITSVVCTVAALAPVVPTFTVILVGIMVVYIAFVWLMYKRIMPLSAATSAAQNKLSGVLSDAVTNILAVKTCGREDFERDLFDAADRAARDAETVSMHAMMQRNFTTSGLIVITMAVVSVFVAGGNAWFGISAGALVMIFTYTYNLTMRLNYVSSMMQRINRALGDAAEMTRVLDEPCLVADDENAPELKVSEGAIDFEHLSFAYRDAAAGESVFDDLTLHVAAASAWAWWANRARARQHSPSCCYAWTTCREAACSWMVRMSRAARSRACAVRLPTCRKRRCCSTALSAKISPTAAPTLPTSRFARLRAWPTRLSLSTACPVALTPWWASAALSFRAASASAWPSPVPFSLTRRFWCSTRRRLPSTASPRRWCRKRSRT